MLPMQDILLHMIYCKRLPTMYGGGIQVPVICPAYMRKEFQISGSPGVRLKSITGAPNFPFKEVFQRGLPQGQLTFPHDMDWTTFVGVTYTPLSVGCYAFLPKEFEVPEELAVINYNIGWWPGDVLTPYAHVYEENHTVEEREDHGMDSSR